MWDSIWTNDSTNYYEVNYSQNILHIRDQNLIIKNNVNSRLSKRQDIQFQNSHHLLSRTLTGKILQK